MLALFVRIQVPRCCCCEDSRDVRIRTACCLLTKICASIRDIRTSLHTSGGHLVQATYLRCYGLHGTSLLQRNRRNQYVFTGGYLQRFLVGCLVAHKRVHTVTEKRGNYARTPVL